MGDKLRNETAAGYMRDSIVDGLGKRHTYPGLYRNYLPLMGVSESMEKLKAELSKLGFPMDIEVWSTGEVLKATIEADPLAGFFGLCFAPEHSSSSNPIPGFSGLASFGLWADYNSKK